MKVPCIVIGGGLSGLAAAIRISRYIPGTVLLEQHSRLGGLNSYYHRNNTLFETGLHAITNYAEPGDKRAPLNRLLRQLKIKRDRIEFCEQHTSAVTFKGQTTLSFSNNESLLEAEIRDKFPRAIDNFCQLKQFLDTFDPFAITPFRSARSFLLEQLQDNLLVDMLLCPLMYYGSSVENDMDLSQFAIMFRAIYQEGFFRPKGTIRDFLHIFSHHLEDLGGEIRLGKRVESIIHSKKHGSAVRLSNGEIIESDYILSTIGNNETRKLLNLPQADESGKRLGFVESIFQLPAHTASLLPNDRTVTFYNDSQAFYYQQPENLVDLRSGVICLPHNFKGLQSGAHIEVRSTHLANYGSWLSLQPNREKYLAAKADTREGSLATIEQYIGKFREDIVYSDTFTPLTIERYTSKIGGAIYGSPSKIKDGSLGYDNIFLAGTDQGFLGIVGSMLSGVSIVNQHILPRL